MPRGLNGTHRELSLTGIVVPDIRRPPALQAREDPDSQRLQRSRPLAASFAGFMNIFKEKERLRREAEASRKALARPAKEIGEEISKTFFRAGLVRSNAIVAGYIPMRGEMDPLALMERLRDAGCSLALTRVVAKDQPLQFHLWRDADAPVKSAFGMMEAAPDWPTAKPDVLLVPLLGFDRRGYRLGYGGGFYDRTLRSLRTREPVVAVGIAYAGQEMILPHDDHDEKLDWIVTEKYARKFEGN